MKIAVDGMGGDRAPGVIVEGSIRAALEFGYDIILVGDRDLLEKELYKQRSHFEKLSGLSKNGRAGKIEVYHAPEAIGMDELPAVSVRRKKDSSINLSVNLVKERKADAVVSAGNTGAVVCATSLNLKLLKGVERPGIAVVIPALLGTSLLIDVGANIDPKPIHLLQYGIMGDVYSKFILNKKNPRIGLLNVGKEESKGTEFVKETHKLLESSRLRFIGNVEGRDLFIGKCDVIICDGFVGNVALKVSESLAFALGELLKRELLKNFMSRVGALLSKTAFNALKKEIDYAEYGGAPLLGIDGICIISHGGSSAKAIKNAIRTAGDFVNHKVNQHIVEAINVNN